MCQRQSWWEADSAQLESKPDIQRQDTETLHQRRRKPTLQNSAKTQATGVTARLPASARCHYYLLATQAAVVHPSALCLLPPSNAAACVTKVGTQAQQQEH